MLLDAVEVLSRAATEEFSLDEMLRTLSATAAGVLEVDGAGVMARDGDRNRFVHATTDRIGAVERLQELMQQGPCMTAMAQSATVAVPDLATADSWRDFQELAAGVGVGSMMAVPLVSRHRGWGVLDLYRHQPGPWPADLVRAAELLANVAVSYVVMAHDRDGSRAAQVALAHQATHDGLTGLPNRGLLFDRLEHALAVADRQNAAVAVIFLDLDDFKQTNDSYGHQVGDQILVEVGRRLTSCLRGGDTVARYAGDEFVLICEGLPRTPREVLRDRVVALTARITDALAVPVQVGQLQLPVSSGIGAAITVGTDATAYDLIAAADAAMYAAKQDTAAVNDLGAGPEAGTAADFRDRLIADLRHAVERGELRLFYQPIYTAVTRQLDAVEALLRWERPGVGLLTAATFITAAVDTGLIGPIGRWVVAESCHQLSRWRRDLGEHAPPKVFINLSGPELADPSLPAVIAAALTANGLRPGDLGLEIVEDHFADPAAVQHLTGYHQTGHPLAVDDFGTGYSSLARLVDFPVGIAKIDKSFVEGIPGADRSLRLIGGILLMVATLDIQVVAEGVETADQARYLTDAGCHLLQGTHLSPPRDPASLTATWRTLW